MDISSNKIVSFFDKDDNLTVAAGLFQLTRKDIQYAQSSGYWSQLSLEGKLKMVADIIGGRVAGYNPFPEVAKYSATFNLSNAINPTSEAGFALWLGEQFGFVGSKWGKRGEKIMLGGAIGGVFDAPVPQISGRDSTTSTSTSGTRVLNMPMVG